MGSGRKFLLKNYFAFSRCLHFRVPVNSLIFTSKQFGSTLVDAYFIVLIFFIKENVFCNTC